MAEGDALLTFGGSPDAAYPSHSRGPTAPTDQEVYKAIVSCIAQILSFKDDQGEPMNDAAREFLVMVPMAFLPSTLIALSSKLVNSTNNPLATNEPFSVAWVANPRVTWTDKLAVFRVDGDARPFIFQEELPVQVSALAEGSELEINENQHQYGVKAIHQAGYGFWQNACLAEFG